MKYEVFFSFVGKKMRMVVDAESQREAEQIILNKPIEIVKTVEVVDDEDKRMSDDIHRAESMKNMFGSDASGQDMFNKIFGQFKKYR